MADRTVNRLINRSNDQSINQSINHLQGDFQERNGRIPKEFGVLHSRHWWSVGTLAKTQRSLADFCCFAPGKKTANQKKNISEKVLLFFSFLGKMNFFSFPKQGVFCLRPLLVGKRVSGDYQFGTWKLQIDSDAKIPNH